MAKGYVARLRTSIQGFASSTESAANKAKEVLHNAFLVVVLLHLLFKN